MIHNQATVGDVIRTAYNTPTYTYGYKLAASDVLAQLHPDVLRAMRLPSRARTGSEQAAHWTGTYLESPDAASAIDTCLGLPTGIGPKITLLPSLA